MAEKVVDISTRAFAPYKFDHKVVPVMIQFVTSPKNDKESEMRREALFGSVCTFKAQNCVLTHRKYKSGEMTKEQAAEVVRREMRIPADTGVAILFKGHPRDFAPLVFRAWKNAQSESYRRDIQGVLDILAPYGPRKGDTYSEWESKRW